MKSQYQKRLKIFAALLACALMLTPASLATAETLNADQVASFTVTAPLAPTAPTAPVITRTVLSPPVGEVTVSDTSPTLANEVTSSATETESSTTTTASSSGLEVINADTGSDSLNNAEAGVENITDITNNNTADVDNNIEGEALSGDNTASFNTGPASIESGDASLTLSIINMINSIIAALPGGQMAYIYDNIYGDLAGNYVIDPLTGEAYALNGARIDISNLGTGTGSLNNSLLSSGNTTSIVNNNDGNLHNDIDLAANTGGNQTSFNTGNGSISTGDANISLNILNFLNSTFIVTDSGLFVVLNIFGDFVGDLLLPGNMVTDSADTNTVVMVNNAGTGTCSVNNAAANLASIFGISNENNGDIDNNLELVATTGDNESAYNTYGGDITTGDSDIEANVVNMGNRNILGNFVYLLVNVLGNWTGANLLPGMTTVAEDQIENEINVANADTGSGSENNAELTASNELAIENNNQGEIDNDIKLSANTGGNTASYNTRTGSITTGDASIMLNLINMMNLNVLAGKALFVIVNVFGDWTGNIDTQKAVQPTDTAKNNVVISYGNQSIDNINKIIKVRSYGTSETDYGYDVDINVSGEGTSESANLALAGTSGLSTPTGKDGAATANYSSADLIEAYFKVVLPLLVVSYLAFLAFFVRGRNRQRLFPKF